MENNQKNYVHKYFDENTELWTTIYKEKNLLPLIIQQREENVINFIKSLNLKNNAKILDLGCGTGLTCEKLIKMGFNVVGLDCSKKMIDEAKKNCNFTEFNGNYEFDICDAENLSLESNTFDVVIAMGLVEYLNLDIQAIKEMKRVVKKGGYLIITFPNRIALSNILNPKQLFLIIKEIFVSLIKRKEIGNIKFLNKKNSFIHHYYYPSEILRIVKITNLKLLSFISHNFGPTVLLNMSKNITFKIDRLFEKIRKKNKNSFLNKYGQNFIILCKKED
tara:strand:+ start:3825 stop:4655 length:831 start_codon:yes stop_codon:yes gene_type:complete